MTEEKSIAATDPLLQCELDKSSDSDMIRSNKKLKVIKDDGRRRTCEGHEEAAKLLGVHREIEKQASDSNLQVHPYVMNHSKLRKLSESRGIKLPAIKMKAPERSQSAAPGIEPVFIMDEYSPVTQVMKDITNIDHDRSRSTASQSFNLLPNNSDSNEPSLELLNIRIFLPDGKSVQFTVEGGKEAQATDLLNLIAEHFEMPAEIIKDVFALWLVSPLFEVQLKPHHVAAQYQKDYERIVDILYLDAKDQYLSGRYLVNVDEALELAALQMAIDYDPYEQGNDEEAFDLVRDKLPELVSSQHLSKVRSFQLFGLSMMECKRGLEAQVVQNFKDCSSRFGSKNDRRIAYLDILRSTPFYGAAFFDGQTERRTTSIFIEYSKRLFTGASPLARMNVRIGIQHEFITVVDASKMEILLTQRVGDCSWLKSETGEAFFLHFPDPAVVDGKSPSGGNEPPPSKLLQIFSKQAVMMEALLNSLDEIAASEIGSANDLAIGRSLSISPQADGQNVAFSYSSGSDSGHQDGHVSHSESSKTSYHSYKQSTKNPSLSRIIMKTGFDQYPVNNNKLSKLCLATLDPKGCCVEAHGTLKKIFVPVH
ncbi:hypothetical protein FO519_000034 [Halicephalobus sp. NKZ332]|nr:hypothetical protein FO519_000034 [Halicephalobus sp. NKZ332]